MAIISWTTIPFSEGSGIDRSASRVGIDRRRRAILGRAIGPTTAAFQHVYDAADHAPIVHSLDAPGIRWQVRFDPLPLLIAQPKQVRAHDPNPFPKENQNRISGQKN